MSRRSRTTRVATALASTAAVLALSSCSWISPQTTLKHYDASDGIGGNVGPVDVRNIMVITTAKDQPGQILAVADNTGKEKKTLEIKHAEGGSAAVSVEVPGSKAVKIDPKDGSNLLLSESGANPGETVNLVLNVGDDSTVLQVPVLDGTLPEYSAYVPAGSTAGPGVIEPTAGILESEAQQQYEEENLSEAEHAVGH